MDPNYIFWTLDMSNGSPVLRRSHLLPRLLSASESIVRSVYYPGLDPGQRAHLQHMVLAGGKVGVHQSRLSDMHQCGDCLRLQSTIILKWLVVRNLSIFQLDILYLVSLLVTKGQPMSESQQKLYVFHLCTTLFSAMQ